jgi:TDG/mug DNA glycosylase family protein
MTFPSASRRDLLRPGLRVVIAGTRSADRLIVSPYWYAGAGNSFWLLLHASGLIPRELRPEDEDALSDYGIGLTDLLFGPAPDDPQRRVALVERFVGTIRRARPGVVAFVSKTAAVDFARAAGERPPRDYGPVSWTVAGRPAFVLPGPSGANNGMPLPVRIALWRDLVDFLEVDRLEHAEFGSG